MRTRTFPLCRMEQSGQKHATRRLEGMCGRRHPCFLKVYVMPLMFTKSPRSYLFLLTERNPKRIFTFMAGGEGGGEANSKDNVRLLFCRSCYRGSSHPGSERGPRLLPQKHTPRLSISPPQLCTAP